MVRFGVDAVTMHLQSSGTRQATTDKVVQAPEEGLAHCS